MIEALYFLLGSGPFVLFVLLPCLGIIIGIIKVTGMVLTRRDKKKQEEFFSKDHEFYDVGWYGRNAESNSRDYRNIRHD